MQCIIKYQLFQQGVSTHILNKDTQGVNIFHLFFCESNFGRTTNSYLVTCDRCTKTVRESDVVNMIGWQMTMFNDHCIHPYLPTFAKSDFAYPWITYPHHLMTRLTLRASNNLPLCFCDKTMKFTTALHAINEVHTLASFGNWWINEKVGCKGANLSILEVSIKMPHEFKGWVAVRLSLITLLSDYPLGAIPQGKLY